MEADVRHLHDAAQQRLLSDRDRFLQDLETTLNVELKAMRQQRTDLETSTLGLEELRRHLLQLVESGSDDEVITEGLLANPRGEANAGEAAMQSVDIRGVVFKEGDRLRSADNLLGQLSTTSLRRKRKLYIMAYML